MTDVSHDHRHTPPTDGDPTLDDLADGLTLSQRYLVLQLIRAVKDGQITSRDLQGVTEGGGLDDVLAAVEELLTARPALPFTGCPSWCVHPEQCAAEIAADPWADLGHDGVPTVLTSTDLGVTLARRALHRPADEPHGPDCDTVQIVVVSQVWKDQEVDGFLSHRDAQDLAAALVALTAEVQA